MRQEALCGLLLLAALVGGLAAPLPAHAEDVHEVLLTREGFEPPAIRVAAGEEVRWVNVSGRAQTLLGEEGSWDSGPLAAGESFALVPRAGGTFRYATADGAAEGMLTVGRAPTEPPASRAGTSAAVDEPMSTLPDTGPPAMALLALGAALLGAGTALLRAADRMDAPR
jgi:plastocyanin